MLVRFVSAVLLIVMLILGLSGVVMLYGTWEVWVFDLHRVAGWSLIALAPWKGIIIYRSLKRGFGKSFDRGAMLWLSLALAAIVVAVILLGLMWMWRLGPYQALLYQTIIAWHWILGLAVMPLFALHVWRRWVRPRRVDFAARRGVLKMLALVGAGVLGWQLALALSRARATEERPRRAVTGSRAFGLFTGNDFPLTGESTVTLDAGAWRLAVDGAVERPLSLTYAELLAIAGEQTTQTLDCTNGWYTVQEWQGIPLVRLLQEAGGTTGIAGVRLVSATGYNHVYPWEEVQHMLLATHVGGEVLEPRHGYPLRAVVPDRRGWFWVKWLVRVQALDNAAEVIAGIAAAPRQVLRQW